MDEEPETPLWVEIMFVVALFVFVVGGLVAVIRSGG